MKLLPLLTLIQSFYWDYVDAFQQAPEGDILRRYVALIKEAIGKNLVGGGGPVRYPMPSFWDELKQNIYGDEVPPTEMRPTYTSLSEAEIRTKWKHFEAYTGSLFVEPAPPIATPANRENVKKSAQMQVDIVDDIESRRRGASKGVVIRREDFTPKMKAPTLRPEPIAPEVESQDIMEGAFLVDTSLPDGFQIVKAWAGSLLPDELPLNLVYYKLRNTNVAKFGSKSRWGTEEMQRALKDTVTMRDEAAKKGPDIVQADDPLDGYELVQAWVATLYPERPSMKLLYFQLRNTNVAKFGDKSRWGDAEARRAVRDTARMRAEVSKKNRVTKSMVPTAPTWRSGATQAAKSYSTSIRENDPKRKQNSPTPELGRITATVREKVPGVGPVSAASRDSVSSKAGIETSKMGQVFKKGPVAYTEEIIPPEVNGFTYTIRRTALKQGSVAAPIDDTQPDGMRGASSFMDALKEGNDAMSTNRTTAEAEPGRPHSFQRDGTTTTDEAKSDSMRPESSEQGPEATPTDVPLEGLRLVQAWAASLYPARPSMKLVFYLLRCAKVAKLNDRSRWGLPETGRAERDAEVMRAAASASAAKNVSSKLVAEKNPPDEPLEDFQLVRAWAKTLQPAKPSLKLVYYQLRNVRVAKLGDRSRWGSSETKRAARDTAIMRTEASRKRPSPVKKLEAAEKVPETHRLAAAPRESERALEPERVVAIVPAEAEMHLKHEPELEAKHEPQESLGLELEQEQDKVSYYIETDLPLPEGYQLVRAWAGTMLPETPPPLNLVYYQLRNTNVAKFGAGSRWGSAETRRAVGDTDIMRAEASRRQSMLQSPPFAYSPPIAPTTAKSSIGRRVVVPKDNNKDPVTGSYSDPSILPPRSRYLWTSQQRRRFISNLTADRRRLNITGDGSSGTGGNHGWRGKPQLATAKTTPGPYQIL